VAEGNEQLIRRGFELVNRGDVEGTVAIAAPDCEIRTVLTSVAGQTHRGHEGVRQWFRDVDEAFEEVEQRVVRIVEVDDERGIVVVRFLARGRGSGVAVDQEIASLWTIRDGLVQSLESYQSFEEAQAAAAAAADARP
jgi:ketosteroid isomerase-like protein